MPLEYCGLPNPIILQATIRKLQAELQKLQSTGINRDLQKHIEQLTVVNEKLLQENHKLTNGGRNIYFDISETNFLNVFYYSGKDLKHLLRSIKSLESSIVKERTSFCMQIRKLKAENAALLLKVQQLTASADRKSGNNNSAFKQRNCIPPMFRQRSRSRSSSLSSHNKTSSLSSGVYCNESYTTNTKSFICIFFVKPFIYIYIFYFF